MHAAQHFIPRFLLEQWHTGTDERLTSFRWAHGQLRNHRYKAKSVAKERHLYSMQRSQASPDVQAERDFFGPHIDEPAAAVHRKILSQGIRSLSQADKQFWSPFLVSLLLRGPSMMRRNRTRGREVLAAGLDERPEDFAAARGPDDGEETLREWVEKYVPDVLDDLAVMTLPDLVFSEPLNLALLNSTWATRSVEKARFDLLMGDTPLIVVGALKSSFVVAIPISPLKAFFASNQERALERIASRDHDAFVRALNYSTVAGAERYVFGSSDRQESFVRKFLRQPAPELGYAPSGGSRN